MKNENLHIYLERNNLFAFPLFNSVRPGMAGNGDFMRVIETKVYKFGELSDDAKKKVIEKLWDLNVDYEWWENVYEDAKRIGLEITEFDLDRGSYVHGEFIWSAEETAEEILKEHGKQCETFTTALNYLESRSALVHKYSDGIEIDRVAEGNEHEFDDECDELDRDFLKSLCEDYRIILSKEYDYLTSEEAIIESIQANEYEFTEHGESI